MTGSRKAEKRIAAWGLVMILVCMVLGGCGKNEQKPDDSNGGKNRIEEEKGQDGQGEKNQQEQQEDSEPVELSIWIPWSGEFIENPSELVSVQEIDKLTNTKTKWIAVNRNTEAREKFGLLIASGDLPDMIWSAEVYYTGGLVQMEQDGLIQDLTDSISMMPNYSGLLAADAELEKEVTCDDGRKLGVWFLNSDNMDVCGGTLWYGPLIRRDWLQQLNRSVPVTIEDWHDTLAAFKTEFGCESPMMLSTTGADATGGCFLTAFDVGAEFFQTDGVVKYGPLEEGYREYVETMHNWFAEGLIDPNFTANDPIVNLVTESAQEKAGAGCTLWGSGAANVAYLQGLTEKEDFYLEGAPYPVRKEGDTPKAMFNRSPVKQSVTITSDCKNVEAAIKWLDFWYSEQGMLLANWGIEGDTYEIDADGKPYLTDVVLKNEEGLTAMQKLGYYSLTTSNLGLYDLNIVYQTNSEGSAFDAQYVWEEGCDCSWYYPANATMTEEETRNFSAKYTDIKTIVDEMTVKFITGTVPLSEYDSFVESIQNYGIAECISYKQAALDRYNARSSK
jgi:putative aldouronate transport system substrate-binding protein